MKVGTWSDYYGDQSQWTDLNMISLNVINLLNEKAEICVANLKDNNNLTALTLDPVTSEILVIHHLTEIGGSLLRNDKKLVALNGFGSTATILRFKSAKDLFAYVIDTEVPSIDEISRFETALEFSNLKKDKDTIEHFRNILMLPPFVTSVLISIPNASPKEWAAMIKAAAGNMKTELERNDGFDGDSFDKAVIYILRWLWCVSNDELEPPLVGCRSDKITDGWAKSLHDMHVHNPVDTRPDPSQVSGPTNEVLNALSMNINTMALNWERHLTTSKESTKKCKFDSLESFIKTMILNASSQSGSTSAVDPSIHVKNLINCSSLARAQISLNHLLQKKNIHIEVPLSFVTAVVNGDWVSRGSASPSKLSFLQLGNSISDTKSSNSEKASLTLQLQEIYNNQLSSESISTLLTCKYASVKDYMELFRIVKAAHAIVCILTDEAGLFALQLETVVSHLESEYIKYEYYFRLDPLFGIKFVHSLDCRFQSFLQKCMDNDSIIDIRRTFYDVQDILDDIERNRFTGTLPASLINNQPLIKSPTKDYSAKGDENNNKQKGDENKNIRPEWRIPDGQRVGDVFDSEAIKACPDFKPGVKCCIRFATKGHCFSNCRNRESHCDWPDAVSKKYHEWQSQHRKK